LVPQRVVDLDASDPASGGSLELRGVVSLVEEDERERVGVREGSELPCGHLGVQYMNSLDGALKPGVCAPLRRHGECRWGDG
jgi:hypothetical protein